jgi:hypothetical protein
MFCGLCNRWVVFSEHLSVVPCGADYAVCVIISNPHKTSRVGSTVIIPHDVSASYMNHNGHKELLVRLHKAAFVTSNSGVYPAAKSNYLSWATTSPHAAG